MEELHAIFERECSRQERARAAAAALRHAGGFRWVGLSEIVVPVRVDGEVRGLLDVESDEADAFKEDDCALLERCAAILRPLWQQ